MMLAPSRYLCRMIEIRLQNHFVAKMRTSFLSWPHPNQQHLTELSSSPAAKPVGVFADAGGDLGALPTVQCVKAASVLDVAWYTKNPTTDSPYAITAIQDGAASEATTQIQAPASDDEPAAPAVPDQVAPAPDMAPVVPIPAAVPPAQAAYLLFDKARGLDLPHHYHRISGMNSCSRIERSTVRQLRQCNLCIARQPLVVTADRQPVLYAYCSGACFHVAFECSNSRGGAIAFQPCAECV